MKQVKKQTQARMPEEIHQWLTLRAKRNNRSMNGELMEILKEAKKQEEQQEQE